MGPLNEQLRKSGEEALLFTEELANWFVDHFGGNFADMKLFIEEVMEKKINPDVFLSQSVGSYESKFKTAMKYHKEKVILDDLIKLRSFGLQNPYDVDALAELIKQNIIARHANNYSWNKRIVCVAYKDFVETERRKIEGENRKAQEENRKTEEERRKKPWYRFF